LNPDGSWDYDNQVFDSLSIRYIWEVKQIIPTNNEQLRTARSGGTTQQLTLGKTLRYIFTVNDQIPDAQISAGEAIDLTTSPTPPTYGIGPFVVKTGGIYDYREELYRRALFAWNSSTKGSEYDEELLSEWRGLFDPRSTAGLEQFTNSQGIVLNAGNGLGINSFETMWA